MKKITTRRRFLENIFILGSSLVVEGWASSLFSSPGTFLQRVTGTRSLMGTFVTLVIYHPSQEKGQKLIEAAFLQMENMIHIFNRHEKGSPLSFLNRQGHISNPPPELLALLRRAREFHRRSQGLFDITIKPVLDLYEESFLLGGLPASASLRESLSLVGFSNLTIGKKEVFFNRPGMGLTLDGLAKGTVIDKTIDFLKGKDIKHALVVAGGDLRVMGGRGSNTPWQIAVYNPNTGRPIKEGISLFKGALATSGCYFSYYDSLQAHFHVLSPESGNSPPWASSATVLAPTAEEADALATSLMLLSPEQGISFINQYPHLAALIVTREGRLIPSSKWISLNPIQLEDVHHG
jgi:FAD:protein FMN transferase